MGQVSNLIQFNTGTGAGGTTIDVAHGLGVTPKGMILWCTGQAGTTDTLGRLTMLRSIGVAVSTTSRAVVASRSEDTPTTMVADSAYRLDAVVVEVTNGGVAGLLDINAIDSTNIQFIVDAQFGSNLRVQGFVFGGTDITNTFIGEGTIAAATGTQDFTAAGFTPAADAGFVFAMAFGGNTAAPAARVDSRFTFGCATASTASKQWTWAGGSNDASANAVTLTYCKSGRFLAGLNSGVTGLDFEAAFNGFITNGFQLDITDAPAATVLFPYLIVKGGEWLCGNTLTQTDTTTDVSVGSLAGVPGGALLVSAGRAESTAATPSAHDELSVGATISDTVEGCASCVDQNGAGTAVVGAGFEGDSSYLNLSTTATLEGRMHCTAVAAHAYTYRMDDADPAQAFVGFLLAASVSGAITMAAGVGAFVLGGGFVGYVMPADVGTFTFLGMDADLLAPIPPARAGGGGGIAPVTRAIILELWGKL